MAATRQKMDDWIPEEYESDVLQAVNATSAVEAVANRIPMKTGSKNVPSDGGTEVDVIAKGDEYGSSAGDDDNVTLTAKKFGRAIVIAEEDLDDQKGLRDVIAAKQKSWATNYAKAIDNACLAVTGKSGAGVPFTSVYNQLSDGDNLVQSSAVDYDDLSSVLALVEEGDYFDPGAMVAIASPAFRSLMRDVKDDSNRTIFISGTAGTPDTLFDIPVKWSIGCKTSAKATSKPDGNPLLVVANRNYLLLGVRSGPESMFSDGNNGALMLNDEAVLKMRARRAFALGFDDAAAVLEAIPAS